MAKKKVIVIGAGFSGISSAAYLAKEGFAVTVLEKNSIPGGRARNFTSNGFTYDMGPSWYWMPDIFESFFADFNRKVSDYYELERLDPAYKIFFGDHEVKLPASIEGIYELYEQIEPGSSKNLKVFLKEAEYKYRIGIGEFVHKPSHSMSEYMSWKILRAGLKLNMFSSFASYTNKYFKSPTIRRMLEFPVLFLGGTADTTPALYSLMNYSDMVQGTWYPKGGMFKVVEAMVKVAEELGVEFIYNAEVDHISINNGRVTSVNAQDKAFEVDHLIATGDYQFIEQKLLPAEYRKYSADYWDKRVLSPSSMIFYLGFNTRIPELEHHTLLFDEDFEEHAKSIYDNPSWPDRPSIYVSCTSRTDSSVAPQGHENVMILIPVAPGLNDSDEIRMKYYNHVIMRLERYTGRKLKDNIVYQRIYAHRDFETDYHAFKGNAYGLANTLLQTAFLKPKMRNSKISNMLFAGQLTVPGPGVPPAIISGEMAAKEIIKSQPVKHLAV
ncbi:MAG TPA: phytoene desaturase family protein [Lentimicrobium sp.]|nr:phytoene desaturase family protein [Lentimicrobium sp.]